jgi:mRNA-degrading endonuclease YafQ of YafQ-DinJ toxin-antitoxin module
MPNYKLEPIKNNLNRQIRGYQPYLQTQIREAIAILLRSPKNHNKPNTIKHLKRGKYFCNWESKEIYGWRLIYTIIDDEKKIKLIDVTPHLDRHR